jgi:hypothetical protein
MEFINKPLIAWRLERMIRMTRSRPYKKNDNCFAEQKNFDVVRKTAGYFRFDTAEEQAELADRQYLALTESPLEVILKYCETEKEYTTRYRRR